MDTSSWNVDLGLLESPQPVNVHSLDTSVEVHVVLESGLATPTQKQSAAWGEFCDLEPAVFRSQFMSALARLVTMLETTPSDNSHRQPDDDPSELVQAIHRAITGVGLRYTDVCIPLQEESPARFVLVWFEIDAPNSSCLFEFETLVADNHVLFAGEFSGLDSRMEWQTQFNTAEFNPAMAVHPYKGLGLINSSRRQP